MDMENRRIRLSERCCTMNICGVNIIGCPDTGVIIGLNSEGEVLVEQLKEGILFAPENFTDSELALINALEDNGFFMEQAVASELKRVYFHVTSRCTLNCEGCYSYEVQRNQKKDLSLQEIKQILDNLSQAGLVDLVISGGEPFLRTDIIDILAYAKDNLHIASVQCISNGTAPVESYLEAGKYLDVLSFSLDSPDEETAIIRTGDVFNSVVEKIAILRRQGVNVTIVFTIHHRNVDRCMELCDFAKKLGVGFRFSIFTVIEFNAAKSCLALTDEDYVKLENYFKNNLAVKHIDDNLYGDMIGCTLSCGAGKSILSISSDGHIYPCHMFNNLKEFCLGNALSDNIIDIVTCSEKNPFVSLSVDHIERCKTCHARYVCGGGCRFRSYALHGSIYYFDRLCQAYIFNKEECIKQLMNP